MQYGIALFKKFLPQKTPHSVKHKTEELQCWEAADRRALMTF